MKKSERLHVYKTLLKGYESGKYVFPYLCTNLVREEFSPITLYPELMDQKPANKEWHQSWWPSENYEPRINALKKAIKMIEDSKPKSLFKRILNKIRS